ncbi:glycoside hydrolase family 95 protein [Leeuwenhoekiella marinoflava]|uniref:Alpha-L-fucosidase 2 n=2 Tax=Leeuwenhoekiella marinoflava TaxID=988 RepID=A0A4Q0PQB3_9FLAO|nr:glycoside hydrolase family 95 protein [Leeuwenhoekiella marinoflava]RXG32402.1 alpha-L-fucosidase 2 [Leeuwenhoekiella marinoflava]SHE73020.1 alpha-L-fucosidase 2 [Leeuwenhoekiella marinoflava DSM 3653]
MHLSSTKFKIVKLLSSQSLRLCIALLFGTTAAAQNTDLRLEYDEPAKLWVEALPVGNGRLGGMIYGNPDVETIQLNENTLWAGQPYRNDNPQALEVLPEARELIFNENYTEAQDLINQKFFSGKSGMPYQTLGNLNLEFKNTGEVTAYSRSLDLENAVATTSYSRGGVNYKMEVFSSFPDQVLVVQLSANKAGKISFDASLTRPEGAISFVDTNNILHLQGTGSDYEGIAGAVKFEAQVKVRTTGGSLSQSENKLQVSNADAVTLYISMATNFLSYNDIGGNAEAKAADFLELASQKSYTDLKDVHIKDYQNYFNRVTLELGDANSSTKTTDQRVADFKNGDDLGLVSLYFQFGRYLLISSSRPGGQPANLQGIWAEGLKPAWDSKYTININTEMNYWPSENTNLSELNEPLVQMVSELSQTGKQTAKEMYGASGWVAHHNTDIWRITGPVDGAFWGMWPMGGAWLSQHLLDKYDYSGDTQFLDSIYTILKGSARFLTDHLVEEPDHAWLVISPSISPENAPYSDHPESVTAGATMDNQLVFDVFTRTLKAAEILGKKDPVLKQIEASLKRLPPMQIGKWGQLQEWMYDWDNPKDNHRHVSHLYGLYPSNQISPYRTPQLFEAAKTSLVARGDESTGWSMGWKVNLWARLLDGNHAYKLIQDQLKPSIQPDGKEVGGTYPNLFDAHPPFQIDGNFGCTAGIAEILMQSHAGAVHILPALPDAWRQGKITGLKARGGFEVAVEWTENKPEKIEIKSALGGICRIRSYYPLAGDGLTKAQNENTNPFYQTPAIKKPLISKEAEVKMPELKQVFEYDLKTEAGKTYKINGRI